MNIKAKFLSIALFFVTALLLASCATGPAYVKVDKIPDGMGLVYIYRPWVYQGGAISYDVIADSIVRTRLDNGGYYPFLSRTGEVEIWAKTESKSSVTLYIEEGQTYYIKGSVAMGAFVGRPHLTIVPPEVGEKEIPKRRLLTESTDMSNKEIPEIIKEILEMQKNQMISAVSAINSSDWKEVSKRYIITGSNSGLVYVYVNEEKKHEPLFGKPLVINVGIREDSDPYIVDWNNDGKKDFVIGAKNGEVLVFINKGTNQFLQLGKEIKLNNGDLDVGSSSSPAMVDWNGDGKKDLIVGNRAGSVLVFFNIGEDYDPTFSSKGIKTDIKVTSNATPFVVDWNNDGKFDVVCGSWDGSVYIFINEGDSKNPKFSKAQMLQVDNKELKLPNNTSVIAVDWDKDGKTDLLVSNKEGTEKDPGGRDKIIPLGIYLLLNTGTKEKPEFKELKEIKGKFRDDTVL